MRRYPGLDRRDRRIRGKIIECSDYKLEETTIHGYKALICQYDDWGCVVKVVIDFGNDAIPNGYYGIQFDINGDDWKDCYSDDVWAIIYGFDNKK